MADKRSGPPSRGGPSKGGFSRGGPRSNSSGGSRGGFGGSRDGGSRGGFGGSRDSGPRSDSRGPSQGSGRPRSEGSSFSDRPKRDFGDRPQRSFSDRPSFNDRPKRDFGDRPQRSFPPRGDRPFGDRPQRSFDDRPKRDFGDRPQRSFDDRPKRDFGDRPQRSFDDRAPRNDRDMAFEDRPRRSFQRDGFGASRKRDDMNTERPKRDFGDRPQRSFDDRGPRPERREYNSDRPRRDFGDRGPQRREGFEKRPSADKPTHEFMEYAAHDALESPKGMKGHEMVIYGVHAVQAALRNPNRKVTTIWVTDIGDAHLEGVYDATRHPEKETVTRRDIENKLPGGAVHQGIAIAVEPLDDVFLSDILTAANAPNAERQVIVVLDEVTDPHNVGAVMRSMSMFGAKAMVVHKRNAPPITGVMAKIATGAVEHIPMVPVTNLAKALSELQLAGFYCLGLDEDATITIDQAPKTGHIALVLGAEGEGLRALTRTTCDAIASIEAFGEIKSLNVSNAAAIALYSITRK